MSARVCLLPLFGQLNPQKQTECNLMMNRVHFATASLIPFFSLPSHVDRRCCFLSFLVRLIPFFFLTLAVIYWSDDEEGERLSCRGAGVKC